MIITVALEIIALIGGIDSPMAQNINWLSGEYTVNLPPANFSELMPPGTDGPRQVVSADKTVSNYYWFGYFSACSIDVASQVYLALCYCVFCLNLFPEQVPYCSSLSVGVRDFFPLVLGTASIRNETLKDFARWNTQQSFADALPVFPIFALITTIATFILGITKLYNITALVSTIACALQIIAFAVSVYLFAQIRTALGRLMDNPSKGTPAISQLTGHSATMGAATAISGIAMVTSFIAAIMHIMIASRYRREKKLKKEMDEENSRRQSTRSQSRSRPSYQANTSKSNVISMEEPGRIHRGDTVSSMKSSPGSVRSKGSARNKRGNSRRQANRSGSSDGQSPSESA